MTRRELAVLLVIPLGMALGFLVASTLDEGRPHPDVSPRQRCEQLGGVWLGRDEVCLKKELTIP